jgi:dihydrofolate synthase/folylpolyglutamate synthase
VITTIDLDHQNFLGNDRVSIGLEKAGIVRAGKPVIIGDPNFPEQVLQFCLAAKSKPVQRNVDFFIDTSERSKEPQKNQPLGQPVTWQWRTDNLTLGPLPKTHIPQDNVALGLAVLQQLNVELTLANVSDYIAATKVPGRTEVINEQPLVVLDVGHNPHAARYLAKFVTQQNKAKIYAVTAMLADKDINSTLAELIESVDYWYTGSLDISRAASADLMSKTLKDLGKHCNSFDNIIDAYRMALDNANNNDMILVFGSFFTVAKIKQSLF